LDFVELWAIYWPKWTLETRSLFLTVAVLILFVLFCLARMNHWNLKQIVAAIILVVYVLLVFASTVFTREKQVGYQYQLELFWSYRWGIKVYGSGMLQECILNVIMLMPIGILLPIVIGTSMKKGIVIVFIGFLTSFSIEFLQLILKRGLFELDDMFHNTLGVVIGYSIVFFTSCHRKT
jgi:glycopeptide antibiotics resistance protein